MKITTIIVAAGSGQRMGSTIPKQFMLLGGRPVLMSTIEAMDRAIYNAKNRANYVNNFVIVLSASQISEWQSLCSHYHFTIPHQTVAGGTSRFESVRNGLAAAQESDIVLVHDGVRPLVDAETVAAVIAAAEVDGAAVPVVEVNDSLRHIVNNMSITVDRSQFRAVQTPQGFRREIIVKAYAQTFDSRFTDDASVVEKLGHPITLTVGNAANIKITTATDLALATILQNS